MYQVNPGQNKAGGAILIPNKVEFIANIEDKKVIL